MRAGIRRCVSILKYKREGVLVIAAKSTVQCATGRQAVRVPGCQDVGMSGCQDGNK